MKTSRINHSNNRILSCFSFFTNSERGIPIGLVDPVVLDRCIDIARHQNGKILFGNKMLEVRIAEGFGVATVQITHEWQIVSVATLVWMPADESHAWKGLLKICADLARQPDSPVVQPQIRPWLAIILTSDYIREHTPQEIASLERIQWALAWGVLERHLAICASN